MLLVLFYEKKMINIIEIIINLRIQGYLLIILCFKNKV